MAAKPTEGASRAEFCLILTEGAYAAKLKFIEILSRRPRLSGIFNLQTSLQENQALRTATLLRNRVDPRPQLFIIHYSLFIKIPRLGHPAFNQVLCTPGLASPCDRDWRRHATGIGAALRPGLESPCDPIRRVSDAQKTVTVQMRRNPPQDPHKEYDGYFSLR